MLRSTVGVGLVVAVLGCGPPLAATDDEVGDELEDSTTATSSDSSEDESSSATTTDDTDTTDDTAPTDDDDTDTTDTTDTTDDTDTTESDTGPIECEPVFDGSVMLDENSTPAQFESLACVEHITGDLQITHTDIADLEFLSALIRVDGELLLLSNDALIDLHGLEALEHVGGRLTIYDNEALLALQGLDSLHELGGLWIAVNDSLPGLDGLVGPWHLHAPTPEATRIRFDIGGNDALVSLDGLAGLGIASAELPVEITIGSNSALVGDLAGLAGIVGSDIDLGLTLHDNPLDSLVGLEGLTHARRVELLGTASQYTSLAGLDNLVSVEERLVIGRCVGPNELCPHCYYPFGHHHLVSLDGLESLQQVGVLEVWGNLVLTDIDALAGLQTVDHFMIFDNPMLAQEAVDSLLANVEVLDEVHVWGNGTGSEPICGFPPP